MKTDDTSARCAHEGIASALLTGDRANRSRLGSHVAVPGPKLKLLVLQVIPTAVVRRNSADTGYECYIGDKPISWRCAGTYSTPNRAWASLGRYANSPEYKASEAAGAFK